MSSSVRVAERRRGLAISAFGIHTGGGLVLLQALMAAAAGELRAVSLDRRLQSGAVAPSAGVHVRYVERSIVDRARALARMAADCVEGDVLLCFNSLPPLRPTRARVITFVQAPHMVGLSDGLVYTPWIQLRVWIERFWLRIGARHCNELWVQTRSMERAASARFPGVRVRRVPLVDDLLLSLLESSRSGAAAALNAAKPSPRDCLFFYPADGVAHKNHAALLQAWRLLADDGDCPQLMLTLDAHELATALREAGLHSDEVPQVSSIGRQRREDILDRLRGATALIFASRAETFGLPLLEARALGRPILAAERNFVRDVCVPVQTFDPTSPHSIADAVRRFLDGTAAPIDDCCSAASFVDMLTAAAATLADAGAR